MYKFNNYYLHQLIQTGQYNVLRNYFQSLSYKQAVSEVNDTSNPNVCHASLLHYAVRVWHRLDLCTCTQDWENCIDRYQPNSRMGIIIQLLYKYGANPMIEDEFGNNCFQVALKDDTRYSSPSIELIDLLY